MNFNSLLKFAKTAPSTICNAAKQIPVQNAIRFVKGIKPSTWIILGSGISIGVAGGVLLCQPEINKLSDQINANQTEMERLHTVIQGYHEVFQATRDKLDVLQAKEYADNVKIEGKNIRAVVMYQYATKEYIELCLRPRDENGIPNWTPKESSYYVIFKKVVNGETLEREDKKNLQNYVYPKYKKEIEDLVEFDFSALLQKLLEKETVLSF